MNGSAVNGKASDGQRNRGAERRRRRWLPYGGGLLLVGLIGAGLWPRAVPVETARVATGGLRVTVNEEGRTRIRQRYVVSAPVTGQLRRMSLKAGAEVGGVGGVVAVIDPLPPALLDVRARTLSAARRDAAAARWDRAKEAHRFAANELERFAKLYAERAVSQQELEQVQWRETAAVRDAAAAESALREVEAELAEFDRAMGGEGVLASGPVEVRAPAAGRVLRLFEESARVVTAGAPLLEVGDPGDLEVVIEVLSRDGAAIQPGARVELDQWGGGGVLEAEVRWVEPAAFTKVSALGVEEQRVNVIADLRTPPEQRRSLGDGFRVEARIAIWEVDRTLKVASGALFRRGEAWVGLRVEGGRAQERPVEVGRSNGIETQVLGGLREGDEVVLYPGDRVRAGQRVRPTDLGQAR